MRQKRRYWWLLLIPALVLGWWIYTRQGTGEDLIFISSRPKRNGIYRMHDNGRGLRRVITRFPSLESSFDISPDGTRIAYIDYDAGVRACQVYVVDADGLHRRQVTHGQDSEYGPVFFPDGRTLVYVYRRGHIDYLTRINIDGTGERQLISAKEGGVNSLAVSPDGTFILFSLIQNNSTVLYRINTDGSGLCRLGKGERSPVISPDGTFIVFASNRNGNMDLYRMNVDGSHVCQLTTLRKYKSFSDTISPDGRWIAFRAAIGESGDIYLVDINGQHLRRLTNEKTYIDAPAFSPDGKRIAYSVFRYNAHGGFSDIYVININGSGRKRLTNNRLHNAIDERLRRSKKLQLLSDLAGGYRYDIEPVWVPATKGRVPQMRSGESIRR